MARAPPLKPVLDRQWTANVSVFALKVAYAALGGIIGGFAYALTGGDLDTAKTVWKPSFYGTYVITPDHLKGNEPVRFYGVSPYDENEELGELAE